jgi:DNA-binding NtrC family response regulator
MLIVDPNLPSAAALARIVEPELKPYSPEVALCADFSTARARLRAAPPELLITALRLREYNGLNLVYLAAGAGLRTRSIVFTDNSDSGMAREVRAAGAFYEVRARLAKALPAYISAVLPPRDRRAVGEFERRRSGRTGGRRAVDQPLNNGS